MTPDTEALRAQFEAWATAAFRLSFDDDTPLKRYLWAAYWVAYQAGHAAAKAETAAPVVGHWYFVANDGAATLCVDEADARESAAEADIAFPRMAPHRAVQLVPADQLAAAVAAERDAERWRRAAHCVRLDQFGGFVVTPDEPALDSDVSLAFTREIDAAIDADKESA